jgi:transcriptional regulator with XRE-family HTH domain
VDTLNEAVSTAVRDIMADHGTTQQQVASLLGRSQSYVSHRLIGRRELSLDIVQAVANLAHMTPRAVMVEVSERMSAAPAPRPEAEPDTVPLSNLGRGGTAG